MPKWFAPLFIVATVGLIAIVGALLVLPSLGAASNAPAVQEVGVPDPGLEHLRIPEFALMDQDGNEVDESVLDGEVTIVDFIFTNCPFACPGLGAAMSRLHSELEGTGVRFASFSVDSERDTPERLRAYAQESLGLTGFDRWEFFTGDSEQINRIVGEHLKFNIQIDETRTIELKDGGEMFNIAHPTRLFLIGPDRRVLSLASFSSVGEVNAMRDRARALAAAQ
ncbi:MAG: SCO family protein [Planctomycetota bacterium]